MASAYNLSDEILRVFVNTQRSEMTLADLHQHLVNHRNRLTTDDILCAFRSASLMNLFNLQSISNELCLVQLNPKLILCELCLKRQSHFFRKPSDKECCFPHKLTEHPNNVILLRKFNYEVFDENLLLDILRLHLKANKENEATNTKPFNPDRRFPAKQSPVHLNNRPPTSSSPTATPKHRVLKSRPPSTTKKSPIQSTILKENVAERQLDICIPSEKDAPDVDLEIVQLVLATKDIIVEPQLDKQVSNDFYRRYTLQFKSKQIVDHLLQTEPVIIYNNVPIKMKRTTRQRDARLFAFKFDTDKKIDSMRLNLYVETLVGKQNGDIIDMTSNGSEQQIYLVRCKEPIDFNHLYRIYSTKNTLQGFRVIITEIYAAETLEVSFIPNTLHKPMSIEYLRKLFGETRWQQDVFACTAIHDEYSADIELMNEDVTTNWLLDANRFERDLFLSIRPIIDFITPSEKNEEEDDEEVRNLLAESPVATSISPTNASVDSSKEEKDLHVYRIKPDWRIVLTHPTFGKDYRKYIGENLNLSVQITGSSIHVPNEHLRKELARHTNMFIQKFVFHEVNNPSKAQVQLIKENYHRMAHKWRQDTTVTLIAAHRDVIDELLAQLNSASRPPSKTVNTPALRTRPLPNVKKQSPSSSPKPSNEESLTSQPSTKSNEENTYLLPYSIENSVYFPFFHTSNSFPDRLRTYLSSTYHITLEIKFVSPTKLMLELSGQQNLVHEARNVLQSLFTSLKNKTYSNSSTSCKFSIPDVQHVAQWHLDQSGIVSSCTYSPRNGGTLLVRYFAGHPQFGADEQTIDDIILNKLYDKSYQFSGNSKKFESQKGSTEKSQSLSIYLCGSKPVVHEVYIQVKTLADEYIPTKCDVALASNQIVYLLQFCQTEIKKFDKRYEDDGVNILTGLKSDGTSQVLAPKYLHAEVKLFLFEMGQVQMVSKDFRCSSQLLKEKKSEISTLASRNHCLLSINSSSSSSSSSSSLPKVPSSPVTHQISVKVGPGEIHVINGDLTKEQVDVIVICSTSTQLYEKFIKAAGSEVEQELKGKDLANKTIDTSVGQLKQAKRLFFIPWAPPSAYFTNSDSDSLRQSIIAFIQEAIKFTIQKNLQSIAFPAIGCGGHRIPSDVIATIMIETVQKELLSNSKAQLTVKFVIQQTNVCLDFSAKLKSISSSATANRTRTSSPTHSMNAEKVTITLTTSNVNVNVARSLLDTIENILA
ncbi:unnamed protein product [Adineta ricciae]|uniref:Macro domain-containing protein n=1 Tax=Adineta ricciae TaxID=249248 RepID=A0A813W641_ADIRI|nr:unnamed protein product [Adineta ricciae]CAF1280960.1 unnamed protein product [Adineta ricciae]